MAKNRTLTNLELTALANVWKKSGCTAYQVMKEFSGSTSAHFRSGAGSIYPIMDRLERDGYLRSEQSDRGSQTRTIYEITAKGRRSLTQWLTPPIEESDLAITPDPIRTRVYFLEFLPPDDRTAFLKRVHGELKQELEANKEVLREYEESQNTYGALAMRGAVRVMEARIDWIAELRRTIRALD